MIKVELDNGIPIGFYNSDISEDIPESAIEITEEEYQDLLQNPVTKKYDISISQVIDYVPVIDIELSRKIKESEIKGKLDLDLSLGFTTNNIKMDCKLEDIMKFDSGIKLAENLNEIELVIRDFDNISHTVDIAESKIMITELGSYYQSKLSHKWEIIDLINISDVEGLDQITW
jgi:uncharacterized protein (DUF488 family)